jgi:hypothetical protein
MVVLWKPSIGPWQLQSACKYLGVQDAPSSNGFSHHQAKPAQPGSTSNRTPRPQSLHIHKQPHPKATAKASWQCSCSWQCAPLRLLIIYMPERYSLDRENLDRPHGPRSSGCACISRGGWGGAGGISLNCAHQAHRASWQAHRAARAPPLLHRQQMWPAGPSSDRTGVSLPILSHRRCLQTGTGTGTTATSTATGRAACVDVLGWV